MLQDLDVWNVVTVEQLRADNELLWQFEKQTADAYDMMHIHILKASCKLLGAPDTQ